MQPLEIAYCGLPPTPGTLVSAWNLDPPLLIALALAACLIQRCARHAPSGWAAWALLVVVFVSPLCALTAALFSARVLHHAVLVAMAAPLLALAFPQAARLPLAAGAVFLAHWLLLWLWHAPAAYAWALDTVAGYWLMQATLLASAWLLWCRILAPGRHPGPALALLLGTVAHMGLLGALILFAPIPLYEAHLLTTAAWGLTALEDQQLAGLLMWVPASVPYVAAGLAVLWQGLSRTVAAR